MISMDKKYRTTLRDEVRLYAVDGNEPRPVHGAFKSQTGWVLCCWQRDGVQMNYPGPYDLIEVKPRIKRTVWVNLFPHTTAMFSHKLDADAYAGSSRLACVKVEIDCEEGEGL
jgi:hypothetical protein